MRFCDVCSWPTTLPATACQGVRWDLCSSCATWAGLLAGALGVELAVGLGQDGAAIPDLATEDA